VLEFDSGQGVSSRLSSVVLCLSSEKIFEVVDLAEEGTHPFVGLAHDVVEEERNLAHAERSVRVDPKWYGCSCASAPF
jgi:hypothetical protein